MPMYEFECPQCGNTFERLKPMSAMDEEEACPCCGNPRAQRTISSFATGKGSGSSPSSAGCGSSRGFS